MLIRFYSFPVSCYYHCNQKPEVMKLSFIRTCSDDPNFVTLVRLLDEDLAVRDGSDHGFYAPFNKVQFLKNVVIAFEDDLAVSCGAMKPVDEGVMEIKRMYTLPFHRGKGCAAAVLRELEKWATALSMKKTRLETGKRQPEALGLYKKSGYHIIPNYGQYVGIENSVCFEKDLTRNNKKDERL